MQVHNIYDKASHATQRNFDMNAISNNDRILT